MLSDLEIEKLELLVDELVKEAPEEDKIRLYMKAAGLLDCSDPLERMNRVFTELEKLRSRRPDRSREL